MKKKAADPNAPGTIANQPKTKGQASQRRVKQTE